MVDKLPLDLDKTADINKKIEESVYDSEYWTVSIPNLPPNTSFPLQFAWVYEDGTVSEYSAYKTFTTPLDRQEVSNVVATWGGSGNLDLIVTFNKTDDQVTGYNISFTPYGSYTGATIPKYKTINKTSIQQTVTLFKADQIANYPNIKKQFKVKVTSISPDGETDGVEIISPISTGGLSGIAIPDTSWSVQSTGTGVIVNWALTDEMIATGDYKYTTVSYRLKGATVWQTRRASSALSIDLDSFALYEFKIQHFGDTGDTTAESSIKEQKATDQIIFDTTPPDPIVSPSGAWSSTDFVISFTMPTKELPSYVKVYLTAGGLTRYIEKTVSSTTASQATSVTLFRQNLIDAFGFSPSSFTAGYVTDLDIYRNENLTQVSISGLSTAVKPNLLSGITTTISVTPLANGYSVSSTLNSNATGIKIYQSSTIDGTYALVASSTNSPVIVYDAANAGKTVFIKGEWTSESGAAIQSAVATVTILSIADISLINNPVKISTDGSIFTGDLNAQGQPIQSGKRMFLNREGLFIYDATSSSPTTQIVGNAATDGLTFITTRAQIANWLVLPSKIENQLSGSSNYTGLAASGSYAFWAGAGVSGGYSEDVNNDAKFSVTHSGEVIARKISVLGGNITVGSKFSVSTSGDLIASNVDLSGTIKAASGILGSVLIGGTISGVNYAGQLKITNGTGKIEIGQLMTPGNSSTTTTGDYGIQGTSATEQFWQLDSVNGLKVNKGSIGGWAIDATTIKKNYTTLNADGSITAGTAGEFTVSSAGALSATGATIKGTIRATDGGFGIFNANNVLTTGWAFSSTGVLQSYGAGTSSGLINGGRITGSAITAGSFNITGTPSFTGVVTVVDPAPTIVDEDSGNGGTGSTVSSGEQSVDLTISSGLINSTGALQIKSAGITEIWGGGAQAAAFSSSGHSITIPGSSGFYIGNTNNTEGTTAANHPTYVTIDGRMRLRRGAPLFYPNGSTGAYVRNIYIKNTTSVPSSSTGHIGDIMVTYG